jgi:hypothetical protein
MRSENEELVEDRADAICRKVSHVLHIGDAFLSLYLIIEKSDFVFTGFGFGIATRIDNFFLFLSLFHTPANSYLFKIDSLFCGTQLMGCDSPLAF